MLPPAVPAVLPAGDAVQQLPPKLHQLLTVLPDVDKVKLLALTNHYRMDLDDPGFLPLLLTQQGIEALEKARSGLETECGKTLSYLLNKSAEAISKSAEEGVEAVTRRVQEGEEYLKQCRAESETAMKQALGAWADESLRDSIGKALADNAATATEVAGGKAEAAAGDFVSKSAAAAGKLAAAAAAIERAAEAANQATRDVKFLLLFSVFIAGVAGGSALVYFTKQPRAGDVYLDYSSFAKQITAECRNK